MQPALSLDEMMRDPREQAFIDWRADASQCFNGHQERIVSVDEKLGYSVVSCGRCSAVYVKDLKPSRPSYESNPC